MWISVDPRSSVPIYQQIVADIKDRVAKGVIEPGTRLPTIRDLAVTITINPNTIAKAYQELEREGVIEVMRGRGTFISQSAPDGPSAAQLAALRELMNTLLVEAHHVGVTPQYIIVELQAMIDKWPVKKEGDNPGADD